ncbi:MULTISPECIES: thiol reductant ABC exporter subunit CydD [Marinobacter]|uniref:Thiol reductant ABC exporter subunit CydD n=1 Tax=Marinobacter profundi TaxID=2666256 RepID=A0A2G1UR97_9GAMM|nr:MULTISPECIES: thiol reductant ABC exporter subunit CydD [Marinobacter]MBD3655503.1 thiol reductant ABC exporter subunit CydD [Marinobacter sp.]PHQ16940.1 thiol reductant ABC exporter subunit CydD [Marinobacter profundi]
MSNQGAADARPGARPGARAWLGQLAGTGRPLITRTVAAGMVAGLATIIQMGLLATIVHRGIIDRVPPPDLLPWFLALIAVIVLRGFAQGLQASYAANCSRALRARVRRELNTSWRRSGPVGLREVSAGTLAREWLDHVEALHGYFARFLPQLALSAIVPLMILVVVFWLDWLAAIFLLLSAPLIPLFMALVGMGAEKLNQQHFEVIGRLSGQFLDKVRGLTTLQIFGQTASATDALRSRSNDYRRITMKTLRVAFLSSAVLEFFASVAIAVVAIYIGFGLLGYINYGPSPELTLFSGLFILLLAPEFFQPIRLLSQHYHDRAAALGAASELLARMDRLAPRPQPCLVSGAADAPASPDLIRATGVHLAYPHQPAVLDGLDLTIRLGQIVALTGPSGGGKSTLLHLLAGFIHPDQGELSVFGEPPGNRPFGWLSQSPFLVQGSWADNLRMTVPEASDVAIAAALRRVGLGPLLDSRPAGIHSTVSEGGVGLSGGQARRLSLARVFIADYDLVLLDEPTAGLDADSEVYVLEAMHQLAEAGKTLVFSTHHQALLTLADRILLVNNGEVRDA